MGPEPSKSSGFGERSFDDRVPVDAQRSTHRIKNGRSGERSARRTVRLFARFGSRFVRFAQKGLGHVVLLGLTSTPTPAAPHALQ